MNQLMVSMLDLGNLKDFAERVSGEWNGDEPGWQEDMAHLAEEIAEKATELQTLLEELDKYEYYS